MAAVFICRCPSTTPACGHSTDQVNVVKAPPELLLEYYDAVHRQTLKPVTLGVRLVSTIADCLQHVGQAAYAKGLKR